MTIIIEGMSRALWKRAAALARDETPPRTLKQLVITLVRDWVAAHDRS